MSKPTATIFDVVESVAAKRRQVARVTLQRLICSRIALVGRATCSPASPSPKLQAAPKDRGAGVVPEHSGYAHVHPSKMGACKSKQAVVEQTQAQTAHLYQDSAQGQAPVTHDESEATKKVAEAPSTEDEASGGREETAVVTSKAGSSEHTAEVSASKQHDSPDVPIGPNFDDDEVKDDQGAGLENPAWPPGDWHKSARKVAIEDRNGVQYLVAELENDAGEWQAASAQIIEGCAYANNDGKFSWTTEAPGHPPGNWYKTARNMVVCDGKISADLKNDAGEWCQASATIYAACEYSNDNGRFVWTSMDGAAECLPPGNWLHTARNMEVHDGTVFAELKNDSGEWCQASAPVLEGHDYENEAGKFVWTKHGEKPVADDFEEVGDGNGDTALEGQAVVEDKPKNDDDDDDDYEEATPEEKLAIVQHFLLNAPPGQFGAVLGDVKALVPENFIEDSRLKGIARVYNCSQYRVLDNKVMVCQEGEIDPKHYVDPASGQVFAVEHLAGTVSPADAVAPVPSSLEEDRKAIEAQVKAYAAAQAGEEASVECAVYAKEERLVVVVASERINLRNYWSGNWISVWNVVLQGDSATIDGEIKLRAHYFEDGNVHLQTTKKLPAVVLEPPVPQAVVGYIESAESELQIALEEMYTNMGEETIKAMRRVMPITRTKMSWNIQEVAHVNNLRKT